MGFPCGHEHAPRPRGDHRGRVSVPQPGAEGMGPTRGSADSGDRGNAMLCRRKRSRMGVPEGIADPMVGSRYEVKGLPLAGAASQGGSGAPGCGPLD